MYKRCIFLTMCLAISSLMLAQTTDSPVHIRSESTATYLFLDNPSRNWGISSHTGNFYITDKTANKDLFTIQNNGNVGIGTSHPQAKLHVNGVSELAGTIYVNPGDNRKAAHFRSNHADGPYIQVGNDTYLQELQGKGVFSADKIRVAGKTIDFTTQGTTSRMHLKLEGNVGIGTTSPGAKLHVRSESNATSLFLDNPSRNWALSSHTGHFYITDKTGNQDLFAIHNNGNVAIGTGVNINGVTDKLFVDGGIRAKRSITTETGEIASPTELSFHTPVGKTMTIHRDGWVAINTTPKEGYTLAVNGTVKAREIEVTLEGWADFVFDKDYKLMPLNQLEKVIKRQHHLPDIPSEKEIMTKGVTVGKMQSKLLQKIEELTLYTIQQHKQISQQKQYINNLEKKVTELRSMKNEIEKIKQVLLNK